MDERSWTAPGYRHKSRGCPVSFNEVEKLTEEKYTIRKYKRILFYVVILVLLAAFLLGQSIYPSERETVTEESITYTGTFYRVLADGTKEEIPVPGKCDVPAGEPLVIRSVLPQDYHENTIAIRSSLENVRIYIGGELRAVYDTENTRPFGKNSASGYVFCETSGEDAGQEVRIELQSFTDKYSGVVNTVYCGDKSDIWAYMFHCYFMVTLIACAMLFAGLVVLIISLVLDIIYKTRFDLEYLGWCMLLGAVWMLGESKLRQLFVSNASILSNMCFFVVMLCPVPILFYIDSVQQGRYRKVYHVAECITCVNFVLCTALQLLNIADFISTMFLSHLVIAGTFLTIFITICRDLIKGTAKHYKLPLIGLVAAMIAVMLEVTAAYRVVSLSGIFIATGLVVLLVVTLIQTMDRIRELELARQREARESLDYLTGLPMRHKGEKLILEKMQEHDGCLGFVDMDNLKKINDVYGHKAGDRALRLVGAMLTECMENAVVCRLGGDEFLFYLPEVSEAEMNTRVRSLFDSFRAAKNAAAETSAASLSCGLCMCRQGDNFEEYYIKADKALYYVKQNGKNSYRFYEELEEQQPDAQARKNDLEVIAGALLESGSYTGALDLDYREFARLYQYVSSLGERYWHRCYLVLVTMDAKSDQTMYIDHIDKAMECMEKAIRQNIRKNDICTRYSSLQHLIILVEAEESYIPDILQRIFMNYYDAYGRNDFLPQYEYRKMTQASDGIPGKTEDED
jgi:diguanylate cyclase (GGDEF)-like protein